MIALNPNKFFKNHTFETFAMDCLEGMFKTVIHGKSHMDKEKAKEENAIFEDNCEVIKNKICYADLHCAASSFFYKRRFKELKENFEIYKTTRDDVVLMKIKTTIEKFDKVFIWI